VLKASRVWNRAQLWFQHTFFPDGNVYTFIESNPANATIAYVIPQVCGGLAVGWTDYTFAPSSATIVSARTYLDPAVFNAAQENNATAKQYAFFLALHELGRILGLGNVIDGIDIMDPLATANRATRPMISTLDLYAVHVLASENTLTSMVVVLNTEQYQLLSVSSLLKSYDEPPKALTRVYSLQRSYVSEKFNIDYHISSVNQLTSGIFFMIAACVCSFVGTTLNR
jgi:hypothetical protein